MGTNYETHQPFSLAWRKEIKIPVALENMERAELSTIMKRFYEQARNVEEKPYSRSTMKAIRFGLDRLLSGSPQVFEQCVGKYEPKEPSFRAFDLRGFVRVNFTWQFVKFCSNHGVNKVSK